MALSPMMQQYLEIKEANKDKIIFFRLGDFYEMFFDDAILVSKELELTLTGRDCGLEERAPMCGVPFHACETYLARLIAKGYKVAICEQMENPAQAKGLVRRDIVRVVTSGTVIESSMLEDDKNNYIASIILQDGTAGLCFADASTGTANTTCLSGDDIAGQIVAEMSCYAPREVLINPAMLDLKYVTNYFKQLAISVELLDEAQYKQDVCLALMQEQFGTEYKQIKSLTPDSLAFTALATVIGYLNETQRKGVERLKTVNHYVGAQYMHLSPVTRANLELTQTMRGRDKKGTLLWVLDQTQTAMGKRLLRTWIEQPLVHADAINTRLESVAQLHQDGVMRAELEEKLSHVCDIERLMTRTVYGSASPREIYALATTCAKLPEICTLLAPCTAQLLCDVRTMDLLADVRELIFDLIAHDAPIAMKDGGTIRPGANEQVDELRDIASGGAEYLAAMEARLKEEIGIRTLKIGYNRVFGYYIEVSRMFADKVPEHFIRKQTLANAERYITQELKDLENKILGAKERLALLERQLFDELLQKLSAQLARIQSTAVLVAKLDVLNSFAQVAACNNYVKPQVHEGTELAIIEGRHPVVEQLLRNTLFVPNDTVLDTSGHCVTVLTGPNMAGKSTYMRQTALIALMAQIGSFVPAKECRLGVVDAIFTRVGASDDLSAGQSTFMVEMTEVAEILQKATTRSLVILDEIGRGTSTFDGMSIARAVVEHIADPDGNIHCKTLFATHYHELTELENILVGVENYNIVVKKRGDDITFLRRIVKGPADDSYGIEVAKLAGLPNEVIQRAKDVLKMLERTAPNLDSTTQLNFDTYEKFEAPAVPDATMQQLKALDVETLTPIEALNFLYELKKTMSD